MQYKFMPSAPEQFQAATVLLPKGTSIQEVILTAADIDVHAPHNLQEHFDSVTIGDEAIIFAREGEQSKRLIILADQFPSDGISVEMSFESGKFSGKLLSA